MIYVFDLDDTLYEERQYVKSGYSSVASYLSVTYNLDRDLLFQEMMELFSISRNEVFNRLLDNYKLLTKRLVQKCLSVYRHHKPTLELYSDAKLFLEKNSDKSMYLITDGNKLVQHMKAQSLGLKKYFKKIMLTSNYGLVHAKPSSYCFMFISRLENVHPSEIAYIGDNPNKDFLEIKKLGFKTIRLMRGMYEDEVVNTNYDAHVKIRGYQELMEV